MNKEEYIQELRKRLTGLMQNDIDDRVAYYMERVDERMEAGASEEEAVAALGPVDTTVSNIMNEIPLSQLAVNRVQTGQKSSVGWILLLIFTFPFWFPLLITAAALIFALYITLWAIVLAFFAVDFALAISSIAAIPVSIAFFGAGNPAAGVFVIGIGLILLGIANLLFLLCLAMAKGCIRLLAKLGLGIKHLFVGKKGV
ncbi:MAG: DUF1700 domain-containing protein [Lachnospiraceae bacterium]|nr:DUF1700 domain-containing protein [Lachnospiraceae bacterium]